MTVMYFLSFLIRISRQTLVWIVISVLYMKWLAMRRMAINAKRRTNTIAT